MLETPHVVVGAAIATKIVNPFLAIPIAFGSHFLLERVPHWNPHLNTEFKKYGSITKTSTQIVIGDVVLSLVLGGFMASRALPDTGHAALILICCFAAVLPDVIEGPHFFLHVKSKLIDKWITLHKSLQADTDPIPGLLTQFITIAAAFAWVLR